MKELSIEEKAKAYDEALERARLYKGLQAEMSVIFPVLRKEIEDERIRKALIHYMKDYSDGTGLIHAAYGVSRNDAIVWLEKQGKKQGEQKPTEVRTTGYWHVEDVEQKPWSEEDEKMINSIAVCLNATTCGFPEDRAWANRFMNWLNSIKDKVQPQPKQEWSEEDEAMFENIKEILTKQGFHQI